MDRRDEARASCARALDILTRAAFAASDEALKMDLLRLLEGVEWPTASTILHFCRRWTWWPAGSDEAARFKR